MSVSKSNVVNQLLSRGHFSQVPNELWDAVVSHSARTIWMYLLAQSSRWDSSISNLARNLGMSRGSVGKAIKELSDKNMLSAEQTKRGTDFTLFSSDAWTVEWQGQYLLKLKTADAQSMSISPSKSGAVPAESEGSIQYSNTSKTINTSEYGKNDSFFKEKELSEDWWRAHFLKSDPVKTYFLNLSIDAQDAYRKKFKAPSLKDEFVCEMYSKIFPHQSSDLLDHLIIDLS